MESVVAKKIRAVLVSPQTDFVLGGVISSAAICFPLHRSLFTVMYFIPSFEYQVVFPVKTRSSMPTGNETFCILGPWFCQTLRENRLYMSNNTYQFPSFRLLSVAQKRR